MTRDEAIQWLKHDGRRPLDTGSRHESWRWYPASEANLRRKGESDWFFVDWEHCLIPPAIYHGMKFPQPEGWSHGHYPWFPSLEAATEAAIESLMANAEICIAEASGV